MNILQKIYFPQNGICNIENMYLRTEGDVLIDINGEISAYYLQKGSKITTNTYFNYFSSSKWLKFTKISQFVLKLELKGSFIVRLIYSYIADGKIQHDTVQVMNLNSIDKGTIKIKHDFELDPFEGMYYFELEALEDNGIFFGGAYCTELNELNKVHIGIVMCTFKREKFIKRNLRLIQRLSPNILSHIDLFIIDNAKTLSENIVQNNNIHLIKNKNTGGAGGFTRGLIEILENHTDITHALLMDDDILLNIIAVERIIQYLMFVNKKDSDLFLGGATLRLDKKNIQLEAGAVWNNNVLYNLKSSIDLNNEMDLLLNNLDESFSYNSWVFLCIPITKIALDDLPLPVFVRGDDMEYGIRKIDKLLIMNGISAWHVPVHNKYSGFMTYYVLRNILLLNSLYDHNFKRKAAIKLLLSKVIREMMYFRYDNVKLIFKAYEDFFGGVHFFLNTDGEKLHQEIMSYCNKLLSYKDLERQGYPFIYSKYNQMANVVHENRIRKLFRLITLNGYLVPPRMSNANKYTIVEFTTARPIDFYRYNQVLQVDLTTQKGYVTFIDRKELVEVGFKLIKIIFKILTRYNYVVKDYSKNTKQLTDIKFWERYLDLKR